MSQPWTPSWQNSTYSRPDQNSLFRERLEQSVLTLRNFSANLKNAMEKSDEKIARLIKGVIELCAGCWVHLHPKLAAEKQRSLSKLIADFQLCEFGFVQGMRVAPEGARKELCRKGTGRSDSGLAAAENSPRGSEQAGGPKPGQRRVDGQEGATGETNRPGFENSFGGDQGEDEAGREAYFKRQYTTKKQISGYFSSMVESPELKRTQAFEDQDFNFETVLKSGRKVDAQVQTDRNPTPAVTQSPSKKTKPSIPNPSRLSGSSISQRFNAIKTTALNNKSSTQDRSSLLKSSFFLNDVRVVARQPETNLYVVPRPRVQTSITKFNVSSLFTKGKVLSSLETNSPKSSSQILADTQAAVVHKHSTSLSNLIELRYDPESEHNPAMFRNLYNFK